MSAPVLSLWLLEQARLHVLAEHPGHLYLHWAPWQTVHFVSRSAVHIRLSTQALRAEQHSHGGRAKGHAFCARHLLLLVLEYALSLMRFFCHLPRTPASSSCTERHTGKQTIALSIATGRIPLHPSSWQACEPSTAYSHFTEWRFSPRRSQGAQAGQAVSHLWAPEARRPGCRWAAKFAGQCWQQQQKAT
jgi:hypothetical protein